MTRHVAGVPFAVGRLVLFTGGGLVGFVGLFADLRALMVVGMLGLLGSAVWDLVHLRRLAQPGQPFWTVPPRPSAILDAPQQWQLNAMVAALLTFLSAFHRDGRIPVAVGVGVAALVVALIPPALRKVTRRGFDPYRSPTAP